MRRRDFALGPRVVVVLRGKLASTNQKHYQDLCIAMRHQYEISVLVSQSSFRGETSGGAGECRLFSRAT